MRVGVAGVGRMGAAIAAHLIEVGHQVTVWNRAPDKVKPLADAGAKVAKTPAELAAQVEAVVTILTNRTRWPRSTRAPQRPAGRRRQGQALHRDEHGAAARRGGAGREGAGQGRHLRRVPGGRHRGAGAAGQAAGRGGWHQGGFREGQAAARPDVPARGARRAGRRRRQHEARAQPAADGLLSGAGGSLRALPPPRSSTTRG